MNCPERFVERDHGTVRMTFRLRRSLFTPSTSYNLEATAGEAPPALARLESRVMNVVEPTIGGWIRCDGPCPNLP